MPYQGILKRPPRRPASSRPRTFKPFSPRKPMKSLKFPRKQNAGKIGWIFLWLIGVPVPVLLILFLLRGCT